MGGYHDVPILLRDAVLNNIILTTDPKRRQTRRHALQASPRRLAESGMKIFYESSSPSQW
jgi:hypothetical protein